VHKFRAPRKRRTRIRQSSAQAPNRAFRFFARRTAAHYRGGVDSSTRKRSTALLRIALVLFAIGLVAIVAILFFPVFSDAKPPLGLYLTAMFSAPAGFVLALVYALASGRRAR
jgi:fatty acid desaturase